MAKKVMKQLKKSLEKRPQIVSHRKWEGRKEQDDGVLWFPGERVVRTSCVNAARKKE